MSMDRMDNNGGMGLGDDGYDNNRRGHGNGGGNGGSNGGNHNGQMALIFIAVTLVFLLITSVF